MPTNDESSGKSEQKLTRLDVREEIDKAFSDPPAKWLERIEREVEARVKLREKYYGMMFALLVGISSVVVWLFMRQTTASMKDEVAHQMSTEEIENAKRVIREARTASEVDRQRISEMANEVNANHDKFMQRLKQIKQQDNVILTEDLAKLFVVQTVTGFVDGTSIVLDYDPVPQTVKIWRGPTIVLPRAPNGYVEGRTIIITNLPGSTSAMNTWSNMFIHDRVLVEYVRKGKSEP